MKRILMAMLLLAAITYGEDDKRPKGRTSTTGYADTPLIPGQQWKVHDIKRPHPRMVTPASTLGGSPSDAIVLFDGKDLSKWLSHGGEKGKTWKVENGYMEVVHKAGSL